MKNENIDHKVIAKHFHKEGKQIQSTIEAFRQLKRKHEKSKDGLWIIYVKAYNWDTKDQ